jgi:hypothetical protein
MTNDEAKRVLENTKRERAVFHSPENEAIRNQALDIALWLLERQALINELMVAGACNAESDLNDSHHKPRLRAALDAIIQFDGEHPRPGSEG